jgi:hypothetical protein
LLRQAREAPWGGPVSSALRPTRAGITLAVVAALTTAAMGLGLLASWLGHAGLAALPWTDVHAAWGLLGWGVGLVASVGAIVLPMFQGTRPVPARAQYAFCAGIVLVLAAGTACVVAGGSIVPLRLGVAAGAATMAVAGLWLQWHARHVRNAWLVRAWRAGLFVLLAAAGVLATGGPPILLGGLAIAIGFPWLVAAMQLEIVAFLGWIELHRRCGRGVRLPPVQVLLPEEHKRSVFAGFGFAALALMVATLWPSPISARLAGLALMASYALLGFRLHGVGRNVRAFIAGRTSPGAREATLDAG